MSSQRCRGTEPLLYGRTQTVPQFPTHVKAGDRAEKWLQALLWCCNSPHSHVIKLRLIKNRAWGIIITFFLGGALFGGICHLKHAKCVALAWAAHTCSKDYHCIVGGVTTGTGTPGEGDPEQGQVWSEQQNQINQRL